MDRYCHSDNFLLRLLYTQVVHICYDGKGIAMRHISLAQKLFTAVAVPTVPVMCASTASASPVSFMDETEVIAQNALRGADARGWVRVGDAVVGCIA